MLSVVIPVYNSALCLGELHQRIGNTLKKLALPYEIILVDDGSQDDSWAHILELSRQDNQVKGLKFSRNFGQHYGITAGLDFCNGDWVVVMDCDLQDPPEVIPQLYQKAVNESLDIVFVKRQNVPEPAIKQFFSKSFYKVLKYLSGMHYEEDAGNFCILSKCVIENYKRMREQLRFFSGLINWTGFSVGCVEAKRDIRSAGRSTYTFKKRLKLATDAIIAYSDKPLRVSIKMGFLISFFSFLFGLYIFIRAAIQHVPIPGWSSLMVSIYFLSGIIIANLGIIGIYLGKTFEEVKRRPLYIIKERTFDVT